MTSRAATNRWVGALVVAGAVAVVGAGTVAAASPAPKVGGACTNATATATVAHQGAKRVVRCEASALGKGHVWHLVCTKAGTTATVMYGGAKRKTWCQQWGSGLLLVPKQPYVASGTGDAVSGATSKATPGGTSKAGTGPTASAAGGGAPSAFGSSCPTEGALNTAEYLPLACRGGKWRWATYDDAPRGPFTKRPSWYPPLIRVLPGAPKPMACPKQGVVFTHSIVPEDQLVGIEPYGHLIGDHVTPIDHAYVGLRQWTRPAAEWKRQPVMSPADGVIIYVGPLGMGFRVVIDHGCEVQSIYMVLEQPSGVLAQYAGQIAAKQTPRDVRVPVKAGQEFASQLDGTFDFNVFDGRTWLRGLNPFSYLSGDSFKLYTADPSNYFTPKLARLYESVLLRTAAPRWGKIDLDVPGSAQGNWFLRETNGYACWPVGKLGPDVGPGSAVPGKKDYSWCHLALVPHAVATGTWMASFGWWADPAGDPTQFVLEVAGKPTPAQLRPSHGAVVYRVSDMNWLNPDGSVIDGLPSDMGLLPVGYRMRGHSTKGLVALRVNADGSLTVETLPGATEESQFKGFTKAARTYVH